MISSSVPSSPALWAQSMIVRATDVQGMPWRRVASRGSTKPRWTAMPGRSRPALVPLTTSGSLGKLSINEKIAAAQKPASSDCPPHA